MSGLICCSSLSILRLGGASLLLSYFGFGCWGLLDRLGRALGRD